MKIRAARMHGYKEPLRLEEIPVPRFGPNETLVKVAAAGMCRSDFQLVDNYFAEGIPMSFPITPGHEIAGRLEAGLAQLRWVISRAVSTHDGMRCKRFRRLPRAGLSRTGPAPADKVS